LDEKLGLALEDALDLGEVLIVLNQEGGTKSVRSRE